MKNLKNDIWAAASLKAQEKRKQLGLNLAIKQSMPISKRFKCIQWEMYRLNDEWVYELYDFMENSSGKSLKF